ncbi:hypothetical protein TNCT_599741 [Trichonephila clavata]|uniref:Uncharacterized protein n=1 Tax=Trichonephila clavata TaxID=2740835 RepID=A0A8X6HXU7_TRICU|nr:hypothetical protein TNCT_599741 [Trichonephila clavata]
MFQTGKKACKGLSGVLFQVKNSRWETKWNCVVRMLKKQFKEGRKKESWKERLSTGIRDLSNESHPTGDMSVAPRLLPRASCKRRNSKREI